MRLGALLSVAVVGTLSVLGVTHDARACGGCFHEPKPPTQSGTVVTDHRMIFSVSPLQTTLYDQVQYAGSPASFAWVLPIHGAVTVGLSSDTVFQAMEQATQTDIVAPPLPQCPASNCPCGPLAAGGTGSNASAGGPVPGVTIISQQTIGPYATVQLQSTNPNALNAWLTANGYVIPADVQPIIAAYVQEGFDFLALKLAPGQGIQAMRPVSVTAPGASLALPLRMVAAGTGPIVGITLWVVAGGRYEPLNFQWFTIAASDLTWDWAMSSSDYTTLRVQKEAASKNWAWQIESSLAISPFQIESRVLSVPAAVDYTPVPAPAAGDGGGGGDAGGGPSADQLRQADLATLFPGGAGLVRITRMRSDLARAALANDLVLQASADQSTISNVYQVTKSVNAPQCPPVSQTCPCFGGGSGSGSYNSSSGANASTGSGGGLDDAGVLRNGASPQTSHGCAASATDVGHGSLGFMALGMGSAALLRARRRRS
jgi:MYXO-CTERM domain-containing protein